MHKHKLLFWAAIAGGVLVFNTEGEYLGRIEMPESATNIAFGPKKNELYVTARSRVLKITLS